MGLRWGWEVDVQRAAVGAAAARTCRRFQQVSTTLVAASKSSLKDARSWSASSFDEHPWRKSERLS